MITVVINGDSYQYPETNDTDWGNAATQAFADLTACTLQKKNAGEFAIENELSFGSSYGIKVLFVSTVSNNPAANGVFKLSNGELVAWRNGNNDGDNSISFDGSDNFVINGNTISFDVNGEMLVNGVQVTRSGEIVNADVAANAGIVESKLSLDYSTDSLNTAISNHIADTNNPHSVTKAQVLTGDLIVNTDVDNSAAIVESKLSLDYSTSSLNSAITSHTGDTNNPHDTTVSNLDDTTITTPANDDTLLYDGSKWVNTPNTVDNLKNVSITTIQDKQILSYDNNSSNWINTDNSVSNLSDTSIVSPASGQVLTYDGNDSKWKNLPSASASFTGLTDTDISTSPLPSDGDVLAYDSNTTMWVNSDSLTNHIGDTNNPHDTTVSNLDDTTITTPSDQDTIVYDNNSSKWINQENSINNLTNVSINSNTLAVGDALVFDDQDSLWKNNPSFTNHIGNAANPHLTTVAKLTDTTITTPANNDVLLYDYANSQWVNSPIIEINDIANINTAVTDVTLTASDKRHQIFTATDGFNITLPSTGIKAGEKVILEFTQDGAFTSNSMRVYVGSTFFEYAHIGNFSYIYTALVDNPTLTTDWMSQFRLRKPVVKYKLAGTNASCSQNTRTLMTTSTLVTLFAGIWDIHYSMSTTAAGGIGDTNPWTSYLVISDTSPYTVLYDRASNDIIGFGVSVVIPRNRSISISDTGTDSYSSWQATNFSKTSMINVLRRSENIKAQNSVYNTSAVATCYFTNNIFCNLVEPVRVTNITG